MERSPSGGSIQLPIPSKSLEQQQQDTTSLLFCIDDPLSSFVRLREERRLLPNSHVHAP